MFIAAVHFNYIINKPSQYKIICMFIDKFDIMISNNLYKLKSEKNNILEGISERIFYYKT
jgi:hypothetical protein